MSANDASERLHTRVALFARGESAESFTDLALDLARFQAEYCPGFARLLALHGRDLNSLENVDAIPGVPADAFRLTRVAAHGPERDVARFLTSGTTSGARGMHAFRTTRTYRELALISGRQALLSDAGARTIVALAPPLDDPPTSSLGFMLALFMDELAPSGSKPVLSARWLFGDRGPDVPALERAAQHALEHAEPLIVLATSFALVELLDALGERQITAPPNSVLMQTGGFKGKTRSVPASELRSAAARAFGIPESHVVGEYGMTELSSQLYEATLPGSQLRRASAGEPGVYLEPPWLRVIPVDPESLEAVPDGQIGLARVLDLGNVDSSVAVQTQDLVRRRGPGIELLGRTPGAMPRGCSLALEELMLERRSQT